MPLDNCVLLPAPVLYKCVSCISQPDLALGRAQKFWERRTFYYLEQDTCFSGVRMWGGTFCRFYCEV